MVRTGASRRRPVHGRARHCDRERRSSLDPGDLEFSQANLQWVISAYALVFGGFLLLGGRTADLLGRRRIFMVGLIMFAIGSLLCGLAWSEASLIGARALQGLGAATISPAALAILMTTFAEGRERNIALGVWGAVGGFGAAAGVLLGGVLTDALSWEWIFFVNIPVGARGFRTRSRPARREQGHADQDVRCARSESSSPPVSPRSCSPSPRATTGVGAPLARSASSSSRALCSLASSPGRTASPSR